MFAWGNACEKAKPLVRVGRKATGPLGWVGRVAEETHNGAAITGFSARKWRPGFLGA